MDLVVENQSNINQKSIQKAIENKMQVEMAFGRLLGEFWDGFGSQVGAKLGYKSITDGILEASWRHLGGIWRPSWSDKSKISDPIRAGHGRRGV